MNTNLLTVVNRIVAEQGEAILSEPRRVSAFFADLARDIPKPQKNAFVKCLEYESVRALKNVSESDRAFCKQQLAQRLHEEEGLDLGLCGETLELLAAVLFERTPAVLPEKEKLAIFCKNCGKELQEDWKTCPYCSTPVVSQGSSGNQLISSVVSSGSGSVGYGINLIKPAVSEITSGSGSGGYGIGQIKPAPVAVSSGSGSVGNGTETIRPITITTVNNAASQTPSPVTQPSIKPVAPPPASNNMVPQTPQPVTQRPIKPVTPPPSSNNTANQNTGALTGGQWFFVLLVAGGVFVGIAFIDRVINLNINIKNTIKNMIGLIVYIAGFLMYKIFETYNKSKKK